MRAVVGATLALVVMLAGVLAILAGAVIGAGAVLAIGSGLLGSPIELPGLQGGVALALVLMALGLGCVFAGPRIRWRILTSR